MAAGAAPAAIVQNTKAKDTNSVHADGKIVHDAFARVRDRETTLDKDRNFRQQRRRRSFDEPEFEPPPRDFGAAPRFSRAPRFEEPSGPPVSAVVKWFKTEKGFGFIVRDGGGKDVFVHASALQRAGLSGLDEGQRVVVDIAEGRKGPEAAEIRLA